MTDQTDVDLSSSAFEPVRECVDVCVGALVQRADEVFRIAQLLDFESAIGVQVETGRSATLRLGDLRPVTCSVETARATAADIADIADEDWQIAQKRLAAIKPLLDRMHIGREEVEERGREVGVNPSTLYRWLQRYNAYGVASALIPKRRGWKAGNSRISAEADGVIEQVIKDFYLKPQRPTAQKAVLEVMRVCQDKGIKPPGASAIRTRLSRIAEKEQLRGRGYKEKAKNKFLPESPRLSWRPVSVSQAGMA